MADIAFAGNVLMSWGDLNEGSFTFELTTAAFTKLSRTDTWRWVTQERINNDPAEQYTGRGSKSITMEGVIYAGYSLPGMTLDLNVGDGVQAIGTHVLDKLRFYADLGSPKTLVDGRGNVLGQWVLVGIKEDQEHFLSNGAPQKQAFVIEFRSYGGDAPVAEAQYQGRPPTVQTPGVGADFQALANATNATTGQTATALNQAGASVGDAKRMAEFLRGLGNIWGDKFTGGGDKPLQRALASLLFQQFGLTGQPFEVAANRLANIMAGTTWSDYASIVNEGIPSLGDTLSKYGVQDQDQAVTQTAIVDTLRSDTDRGAQMKALGTSLDKVATSDAAKSLGINALNDPAVAPVDKYATTLSQFNAAERTNPDALHSAFPKADNAALYQQAAAQNTGELNNSMQEGVNQGLSGRTTIAPPGG